MTNYDDSGDLIPTSRRRFNGCVRESKQIFHVIIAQQSPPAVVLVGIVFPLLLRDVKDPEEVAKKREEEERRAKSYRDNHMACAHDRSAVSS